MSKTSLVLVLILTFAGDGRSIVGDGPPSVDQHEAVAAIVRRHRQLPLSESEALVAAAMARDAGEPAAEIEFLERACAAWDLAEVARVELAEVLVAHDPERALGLVLPSLERAASPQLREAAADITVRAMGAEVPASRRGDVERLAGRLPRTLRRRLEVAAVSIEDQAGRQRLSALIRGNPGDRAALAAARRLERLPDLSEVERWRVAQSLYRHALYDEAVPRLEALLEGELAGIPGWEVALLRGRCAFRGDDWETAGRWYVRALGMTSNQRNRAELEVHRARTLELAGRLDEAVEAARLAVVADTTDARRLLLARLRIRTGRLDLAEAGIARIRGSSDRARGRLLVALHHLGQRNPDTALVALREVTRRPWRGPARVLEARLQVRAGRGPEAIQRLEEVVGELDNFWGSQARRVMASLPGGVLDRWRVEKSTSIGEGGATGWRDLVRLAILEPDPGRTPEIQRMVADRRPATKSEPRPRGIAAQLWDLGLRRAAVRWGPDGFPTSTALETEWSAMAFLDAGDPARAIRVADAGWRARGADIPPRCYSDSLVSVLFPLPDLDSILEAAGTEGVDPGLVAGVAREESRWDPRVLSVVGARGLMQVMPGTAVTVAARLGRPAPRPEELFDPELSLVIGAAELGRLSTVFGGFDAAAVAAYNAGESQSRLWLDQCGGECDAARFVLTVTFDATRGYTADVLAATEVYRAMITGRTGAPGTAHDSARPSGRSRH